MQQYHIPQVAAKACNLQLLVRIGSCRLELRVPRLVNTQLRRAELTKPLTKPELSNEPFLDRNDQSAFLQCCRLQLKAGFYHRRSGCSSKHVIWKVWDHLKRPSLLGQLHNTCIKDPSRIQFDWAGLTVRMLIARCRASWCFVTLPQNFSNVEGFRHSHLLQSYNYQNSRKSSKYSEDVYFCQLKQWD